MLIRSSWIFDSILVDVWVIAMDDCGLWIDVRLFSSAEKEFLASQRKVFNDAVVNFLSVRRSMMFFDLKRLSPFGTFWKHQVGNMHVWYKGFHVKWHTRNIDVQQPRIVKTFNLRVSGNTLGCFDSKIISHILHCHLDVQDPRLAQSNLHPQDRTVPKRLTQLDVIQAPKNVTRKSGKGSGIEYFFGSSHPFLTPVSHLEVCHGDFLYSGISHSTGSGAQGFWEPT